jgi:hypothetical protein
MQLDEQRINIVVHKKCYDVPLVEHGKEPCRRSGSEVGRSTVMARTVRACVESVRVTSFSRDLLSKTAGLARETVCNRSRPPFYIDKGLRPINPPTIDQIKSISRFTYVFWSSSSLVF